MHQDGRRRRRRAAVGASSLLLPVMVLSACGGSASALKRLDQARGKFTGAQGRIVVIVNPGVASPQHLRDDLDPVISQAATNGARVRAFVLNGGSAASMSEIRFSAAAGGGNFYPPGANSAAWASAAGTFRNAAMSDLGGALVPDPALTATGNDVVGALRDAISTVLEMPGSGPREVVIVTGGGVQRGAQLDLVTSKVSPSNASALAGQITPVNPRGVDVRMIGVGRFEGISVDQIFADGVVDWWHSVCPPCQFR